MEKIITNQERYVQYRFFYCIILYLYKKVVYCGKLKLSNYE